MSSSHSSPDRRHPSEHEESLSEAVLDASSTQNLVPEKYHKYLDKLREGIRDFCKEFGIPNEALRSVETFGMALNASHIPAERMTAGALLFERLEHLVTYGEPLRETSSEYLEDAERLYNIRKQYDAQVTLLEQVGILNDGVITGIDGEEYPIPTLEQIVQRLHEREKDLYTKRDQGFTKLLLVPFGMSLDALSNILRKFLLTYGGIHPDFHLDARNPFYTDEDFRMAKTMDSSLIYFPKVFDRDHHQGKTKADILKDQNQDPDSSFPGWMVHLFQPSHPGDVDSKGFIPICRDSQNIVFRGEENPRPDFGTGKAPSDYLSILQEAKDDPLSPYSQESGLTPEDWIIAFMTQLQETGKTLDTWRHDDTSVTAELIGAFFLYPENDAIAVPCAYWNGTQPWACLSLAGHDTRENWDAGVRTSVIV